MRNPSILSKWSRQTLILSSLVLSSYPVLAQVPVPGPAAAAVSDPGTAEPVQDPAAPAAPVTTAPPPVRPVVRTAPAPKYTYAPRRVSIKAPNLPDSWEDLDEILEHDGTLVEASFLGLGEGSKKEYRLHLIQYQDRADTFVGVFESEARDIAVIGFVTRDRDGSYLWKQISTGPERDKLEIQSVKNPMYRLTVFPGRSGLPERIELSGAADNSNTERVNFGMGRSRLMRRMPILGEYRVDTFCDGCANWSINAAKDLDPKSGVWHLTFTTTSQAQSQTEKDLARFDIPGVLSSRETEYSGDRGAYVPEPSASMKWAIVNIWHTYPGGLFGWGKDNKWAQLLAFELMPVQDEKGRVSEYVLARPKQGYRLKYHVQD